MYRKDFYPLEPAQGEPYVHTFEPSYWNTETELERFISTKGLTIATGAPFTLASTYLSSSTTIQVEKVANFAMGSEFVANEFPAWSLVKTVYEAAAIRRSQGDKGTSSGSYEARQWPTGFSVNYQHPELHATYTRRIALHVITPSRQGPLLANLLQLKQDFEDNSFVGSDEIGLSRPESFIDQAKNCELYMDADKRAGWSLGKTYTSHVKKGDSMRRPLHSGYLRILNSEVFRPVKTLQRPPRPKEKKFQLPVIVALK